jgi:hypothetical protein
MTVSLAISSFRTNTLFPGTSISHAIAQFPFSPLLLQHRMATCKSGINIPSDSAFAPDMVGQ